ncbi:hypothetical protein CKO37_08950 [Rubrivivax gelatinosus]|nr:hypothetical protein [Rubrivivax gelatinosus]
MMKMKLATKLLSGFISICALGALVSAVGIRNMATMHESTDRMYSFDLLGLSHTKEANINLLYISRELRNALLASSEEQRGAALQKVDANLTRVRQNMELAKPLFTTESGRAAFSELERNWSEYVAAVDKLRAS